MEKSTFQQMPVIDVYNTSSPVPQLRLNLPPLEMRVPKKKLFTESGTPVLAVCKGIQGENTLFLLITKERRGYVFGHACNGPDILYVSNEEFSLLESDLQDIESYFRKS